MLPNKQMLQNVVFLFQVFVILIYKEASHFTFILSSETWGYSYSVILLANSVHATDEFAENTR